MCVGVEESRRSDFSDQHRLHGSIHYPGYLKDVNVRQKNKSTGCAIYFPCIKIVSVLSGSLVDAAWRVLNLRIEGDCLQDLASGFEHSRLLLQRMTIYRPPEAEDTVTWSVVF